jgi:hypothetical protein
MGSAVHDTAEVPCVVFGGSSNLEVKHEVVALTPHCSGAGDIDDRYRDRATLHRG